MEERNVNTQHTESKGLEGSLQTLINIHHHKSLILTNQTEKAKKDAIRKAERVSDLLVEAVNGGVQDSFIYQKRIELEIRALAVTIARFVKQTDQWLNATHSLNTALKVPNCFHFCVFFVVFVIAFIIVFKALLCEK